MREIALHLLDLAQNSLAAGARHIRCEVTLCMARDRLALVIADDGRGIPRERLPDVVDPFYTTRTTRRIGLGLPLLKAAAERCGGEMTVESLVGVGTTVRAAFRLGDVDRTPLGDLAGTFLSLIVCNPWLDLELKAAWDGGGYDFSTAACREILGPGVPLDEPSVLDFIRDHLRRGLADLQRLADVPADVWPREHIR